MILQTATRTRIPPWNAPNVKWLNTSPLIAVNRTIPPAYQYASSSVIRESFLMFDNKILLRLSHVNVNLLRFRFTYRKNVSNWPRNNGMARRKIPSLKNWKIPSIAYSPQNVFNIAVLSDGFFDVAHCFSQFLIIEWLQLIFMPVLRFHYSNFNWVKHQITFIWSRLLLIRIIS